MAFVEVDVKVKDLDLQRKLDTLLDTKTMTLLHNILAKMCDPYVPFLEGPLSQTIKVTDTGVTYTQPYARYQYYGVNFNHTTDYHPQATALWDKVMLSERGDEFRAQVEAVLRERAREVYGS